MSKKIIFILVLTVAVLIWVFYEAPLRVGFVLSVGGDSQPFNAAGLKGIREAEKKYGIKAGYKTPYKIAEIKKYIFYYAEKNYDIVIGLGFLATEAIVEAAHKYPDSHFVLIDGHIESYLPNLTVVKFNHAGGSFLAGVLSAMTTSSNKIGFIGGMPSAVVKEFEEGFVQGIYAYSKKEKKDIEILIDYISRGPEGFSNPQRAYAMGEDMINKGADIIFAAAGGSGAGIINLARESKCFAVGVDINQDAEAKGKVLTSVVKQIHKPVIDIIGKTARKQTMRNNITGGLKEGWINLTDFKYTKDFIGNENLLKLKDYYRYAEAIE